MKFKMVAYSGQEMHLPWWGRVVIDIGGLVYRTKLPCLREHAREAVAGTITSINKTAGQLIATGELSQATESGREIAALLRERFPYQASLGLNPLTIEKVTAGGVVSVNGRNFSGPLTVIRTAKLGEISICALGADDETSVSQRLAAAAPGGLVRGVTPDQRRICEMLSVSPDEFQAAMRSPETGYEKSSEITICEMLGLSLVDFHENRRKLRAAGLV